MNYSLKKYSQLMCCAWTLPFENSAESQRKFEEKYNQSLPSKSQINYWKSKLIETDSSSKDRQRSGRPVIASGDENQELVLEQMALNPHSSVRQNASDTDVVSVFR